MSDTDTARTVRLVDSAGKGDDRVAGLDVDRPPHVRVGVEDFRNGGDLPQLPARAIDLSLSQLVERIAADWTVEVGDAIKGLVMEGDSSAIGSDLHICFQHVGTKVHSLIESGECVLGCEGRTAPVCKNMWPAARRPAGDQWRR